MSETPVRDSLQVFVEGARVNFNMYGEVLGIFGGYIAGQEPFIRQEVFRNPSDKEEFRLYITDLIAQDKLKEFVLVSECWTAVMDEAAEEWVAKHGTLSTLEGREEAVQVMYCSPSEEICYTATIDRGTIPASLGKWQVVQSGGSGFDGFFTRFQGLFAKGKAGQN